MRVRPSRAPLPRPLYTSAQEKGTLASVLHWHPYPYVGDKSIIVLGTCLGYLIADVFPSSSPTIMDDLAIAKLFRRLSKWHFQTKPLPAWNAGTISPSPSASKSSSLPGGIPTIPSGVHNVAGLARVNSKVTGTPTDRPGRCTQQYVPSVALTPWFLSGPVVTDRCTVTIASAQ